MFHLNTLFGGVTRSRSLIKRLGRGVSSGHGKTCGRGHKGQKSRSGFSMRRGFEGGQMPLCRRLPKFGFTSRKVVFSKEIRLSVLCCIPDSTVIDLNVLKSFNIIGNKVKFVKVIMFGQIKKAIIIRGIKVTKGARSAIEAAGGKVEV